MTKFANHNGKVMALVVKDLDRYQMEGAAGDVIDYILTQSEGVTDPVIHLSVTPVRYEDYDEPRFSLTGYRERTDAEAKAESIRRRKLREEAIEKARKRIETAEIAAARADREALDRVRANFPDLLKPDT